MRNTIITSHLFWGLDFPVSDKRKMDLGLLAGYVFGADARLFASSHLQGKGDWLWMDLALSASLEDSDGFGNDKVA